MYSLCCLKSESSVSSEGASRLSFVGASGVLNAVVTEGCGGSLTTRLGVEVDLYTYNIGSEGLGFKLNQ